MSDLEYAEIFREEAAELLEELEASLLELEKTPEDLKLVSRVFRAMHTIKGSGAMFGFDDIADFTHHVETVLDKVRDGTVPVTRELIDLTLASRDHICNLLDAASGKGSVDPDRGTEIVAALEAMLPGASQPAAPAPEAEGVALPTPAVAAAEKDSVLTHYRICFEPSPAFYEAGGDVERLLEELAGLGERTVFLHKAEDRENETSAFWEILLTTAKGMNAIRDVLIFWESSCEITINPLITEDEADFLEHRKLGEILVERGDLDADDLRKVLAQQKPIGEMLVEAKLVSRAKVESALAEQKLVEKKLASHATTATDSIRVASDKLDQLINLVGELVVTQARLTQVSSSLDDKAGLLEPVEEVERLTAELRDCVLNIRMVPIGTSFARFKRLVRDLSAELGKEVAMVTEGAETELDKNVIDQLGDPLVHLIRNSIDHGIEIPDEREVAGKPRKGTIRLAAAHSGANVVITVSDDGKGLNAEKIREKAVAKGLFKPDQEVSEPEILNSIFTAGLSTAEKVTSVSGRGVGMDVVKSTIEGLKGSVEVTESAPGRGTVITITMPLTLAIIDGLLVRVGSTYFVLPLGQVEECVEFGRADMERFHGRRVLPVRDLLVPYVRLRDFFGIEGERPDLEQMVIVQINDERTGLVLDNVIGEHQTVIKSLGWVYRNAEGVSGSTILGNGEVALILDVPGLIQCAQREETVRVGS